MWSVGILVFDEVDALDFCGPFDVFSTAARVHARTAPAQSLFRCFLVAAEMRPVRARGGLKVLPDCVLMPSADIDILVVPGGDVSRVIDDAAVIGWLRAQAGHARVTASVCAGALLLARAGIRDGEQQADCDTVATAGGISAGIDLSLRLVERLAGQPLALATAGQMEYRWKQ